MLDPTVVAWQNRWDKRDTTPALPEKMLDFYDELLDTVKVVNVKAGMTSEASNYPLLPSKEPLIVRNSGFAVYIEL